MLLQSLPGVAAPIHWFSDDFETGTLRTSDTPAGRWDDAAATSPNTLASGAAGAHRGRYGLTVTDRTSNPGSLASASVEPGAPLSSEFHVRTWLRLRAVSASGSVVAVQALPALVELRLLAPEPTWELAVRNGSGRTYVSLHGSRVEAERWYLVEFSARGLGTTAGEARLWVDGVEQGVLSGRDWRDAANVLDRLVVGEPWSDTGTFVGSLDFDDVRVSTSPMASRLGLQRPQDTGASSGCIPMDVSLRDSATGAPAPAPYETEVALSTVAGAGGFHADAACGTPSGRALLAAGTSERRVYFRPGGTAGTARVEASHPDFLSATLAVEHEGMPDDAPDADDAATGPWTMTPGCTSAPGALVALPVLVGPWLRRGRWRR
ncbi:LamG-like jellyroll fold domain-containing protein [Melittangium boletus]|uniref:LamG-like jellyroll fold domain-containing protein n=1 Tax=Melittangium boletus TaxID=83453 RepID=UPI0012FDBD4C|nr:LamG-like jellyroll fold domain-containing protein [Melittangium boletus]